MEKCFFKEAVYFRFSMYSKPQKVYGHFQMSTGYPLDTAIQSFALRIAHP